MRERYFILFYFLIFFEEAVQFINKEEELFKWELTKYPELDKLKVNIEPYQKFFNLVLKWQRTEKRQFLVM